VKKLYFFGKSLDIFTKGFGNLFLLYRSQTMSNFVWIILIVGCLTFVGIVIQSFLVLRYYWGERGTPPPNREERRRLREKEFDTRQRQRPEKNKR
jgi:hypothetical protein